MEDSKNSCTYTIDGDFLFPDFIFHHTGIVDDNVEDFEFFNGGLESGWK